MAISRERLEAPLQDIARMLDRMLREAHGERCGFALLVFDFEDKGANMAYVSNAEREGVVSVMKEMGARLEAGITSDLPGPKTEA